MPQVLPPPASPNDQASDLRRLVDGREARDHAAAPRSVLVGAFAAAACNINSALPRIARRLHQQGGAVCTIDVADAMRAFAKALGRSPQVEEIDRWSRDLSKPIGGDAGYGGDERILAHVTLDLPSPAVDQAAKNLWIHADQRLIVTRTGQTDVCDAYALIKGLTAVAKRDVALIVQGATREAAARTVAERLALTCQRFLGVGARLHDWLPPLAGQGDAP